MEDNGGIDNEELHKIDVKQVILIQAWVRGTLVRKWMKKVKTEYQQVVSDIERNSAVWVDWISDGLCKPQVTKKKRLKKNTDGLKDPRNTETNIQNKPEKESQNSIRTIPEKLVDSALNSVPIDEDETGFNSVETQTSLIEVLPQRHDKETEETGAFLTGIDTTWADRKTETDEKDSATDVDLHLDLGSETESVKSRHSGASLNGKYLVESQSVQSAYEIHRHFGHSGTQSTEYDTQPFYDRNNAKESTDFEPHESLSERSLKSNDSVRSIALSQSRSDQSQRSVRSQRSDIAERSISHRQQPYNTDEEYERIETDRSCDRKRSDRSEWSKRSDDERSRSSAHKSVDDKITHTDRSDNKSTKHSRSGRDNERDRHKRSSESEQQGQRSHRSDRSDDRKSDKSERSRRSDRSSRSKGDSYHHKLSDEEGQRSHRSDKSDEVKGQRSDRSRRSARSNKSNGQRTPERSLEREPVNMKPRHSSRSPVPTNHLPVTDGTKGSNSNRDTTASDYTKGSKSNRHLPESNETKGGNSHRDLKMIQDCTSLTNVTSVWGSFNSVLESKELNPPTQSLPQDPNKLRELRKNVAMELLWVQQAIQSRKNYLRLKGQI